MRYLQVSHIPFMQLESGEVMTDALWAHNLKAIAAAVGPLRLLAPELPAGSRYSSWSPGVSVMENGEAGVTFVGFAPVRRRCDFPRLWALRQLLRREIAAADIVHTSNSFPPYLAFLDGHAYAVRLGKKTVIAVVEDCADMVEWQEKGGRQLRAIDRRMSAAVATASLTFLFTPAAVEKFRAVAANGVAVRDVTHDASDVINGKALKEKCRQIEKGVCLRIVAACRHYPMKGLDLLIEAIAILRQWDVEVTVNLYGEGPAIDDLRQQAISLGVADCITFDGAIAYDTVFDALGEGHICAMPHRTHDFARAFYDAMAAATPVVAFDTIASRGTLRNGIDGLLVARDNAVALALAIKRLDQERTLLATMAMAAQSRALVETGSFWHRYRAEKIAELFP